MRLPLFLAAALLTAACATPPEQKLTEAQIAALQTTWVGKKWDGTWGDPCTGSIEVFEVVKTTATVEYSFGICRKDGKPGSTIVKDARVGPNSLFVPLRGTVQASYTLKADGSLDGVYRTSPTSREYNGKFFLVTDE